MKICINGTVRNMTEEEISNLNTDDDATESDYIDALKDLGVEVDG